MNGFVLGRPFSAGFRLGSPLAKGGAVAPAQILLNGGYAYLGSPWSATEMLVSRISYDQGGPSLSGNDPVNPSGIKRVPIGTATANLKAAFDAAPSTAYIAAEGDDSSPLNYNGTYIGGAHGAFVVKRATAPGHGKTVADVGSQWDDSVPINWTLLRVVDANTLDFISANSGTNAERWAYTLSLSGTLTHSAGATNTASIVISGAASTQQLLPAIRLVSKTLTVDGVTVSAPGSYAGRLQITEIYDIMNVESIAAYVRAGRPWASQPSFNDASIHAQCRCTFVRTWERNGSQTLDATVHFYDSVNIAAAVGGFIGLTQLSVPNWNAGESLSLFIPRYGNLVGGLKTWNFSNEEIISGAVEALNLSASAWSAPVNPPNRMALVNKSAGGVRQFGMVHGYSRQAVPGSALGSYATRTGFFSALRKTYPAALTGASTALSGGNTVPAGFDFSGRAYRIPYNLAAVPEATTMAVRLYQGGAEVMLDFVQNVSSLVIPLPPGLNGKSVTVLNSDGGFALDTATVVNNQIRVTVTGGKGSGELEIA